MSSGKRRTPSGATSTHKSPNKAPEHEHPPVHDSDMETADDQVQNGNVSSISDLKALINRLATVEVTPEYGGKFGASIPCLLPSNRCFLARFDPFPFKVNTTLTKKQWLGRAGRSDFNLKWCRWSADGTMFVVDVPSGGHESAVGAVTNGIRDALEPLRRAPNGAMDAVFSGASTSYVSPPTRPPEILFLILTFS